MALINKLNAIGDAIREKTGKTDLLTLDEMPIEIAAIETGGGGEGLPEEALLITGNCGYRFAQDGWNWFLDMYGDKITTKDISDMSSMFYYSKTLKEIPFDLNIKNCRNMSKLFQDCQALEEVPLIKGELAAPTGNYSGVADVSYLFNGCCRVRHIPYDYFRNFGGDAFWEASKKYSGNRQIIFSNCQSLRQLPDISMLKITSTSSYAGLYYCLFQNCYVLDEAINIPVLDTCNYTSNAFSSTFNNCYRLKDIMFETNEDGTPITATWKKQTIDLTTVGQVGSSLYAYTITNYNSGITSDTEITDINSYQELKDNPDSWTVSYDFSRYNHDSAVRTINSLPDVSSGITNTIKFYGAAGSKTDGGAINTLTEAEIAVAAAKGWTVTLS